MNGLMTANQRKNVLRTSFKIMRFLIFFSLLALILTACVIPGASTPVPESTLANNQEPEPANPAYTAAAQTIIAQLTAVAPTKTSVPPEAGAETPVSQMTAELSPTETTVGGETPSPEPTQTAEPDPTMEPSPTEPPQPSPTPATNDPRARLGEPDWRDTFNNANNWPLFEDEHVHFRLQDGGLQLLAKKPEKWDGWMLSWTTLENFYLEVNGAPQNCTGADRYGLLGRAPSAESAYLFGFTCDGQYSLRKWNGERFSYLVDWTASDWIKSGAGQTNRLGFMAIDNQISLYANGEPLVEITDPSYDSGAFGLFISSANTENLSVMVSEVAYWELP
jgi:hypothetical protein